MRCLQPLQLPTHLRNAVNNQIPNIDFITRALESNVDVTDTTMPFVDCPSFKVSLNDTALRSNIGLTVLTQEVFIFRKGLVVEATIETGWFCYYRLFYDLIAMQNRDHKLVYLHLISIK